MSESIPAPKTPSRFIQNIVPLIVACALFMENLDGSIIATALPAISRALNTHPVQLNLAITSYLFSLAVFIPLSGWMADRFGTRLIFRTAILIFVFSSVGCGLAQTLPQLVIARICQGLGGAMMVPVGRLVLLRTIPKAKLVSAMAWVTVPALVGPVLGPPIGGLIVTYWSWHWIFFINVPIGLVGFTLATYYIDDIREPEPGSLDIKGFLMMALALGGLVAGFEFVGRDILSTGTLAFLLIGGALCLAAYVLYAKNRVNPIIDITLFKIQTFRAVAIGGSVFRMGIGALPFLLPLMLQVGFGFSPLNSGLLTFASAAGALLMKLTAAKLIRRFGFRQILMVNTFIASFCILGIALFTPHTPYLVILGFLLFGGFFRSLQFTSLNTLSYADIPPERMSRATTLASMIQQLSLSLGVGAGALLLHLTMVWQKTPNLGPTDFWPAIVGVSLISMLAIFSFRKLPEDAGSEISGRTKTATSELETDSEVLN